MAREKKTTAGVAVAAVPGPKSFTVRLDGSPNEVAFVQAHRNKKGAVSFAVIERGPKGAKTRERVCTAQHANLDEAMGAVQAIAKRLTAAGLRVRESRGFDQRKPDAFGMRSLPAPAKK
jgi:hypothetical protein